MVKKYKKLIGKKINMEFEGKAINSYKITEILPTLENMEGRGKLYKCSVDWENKDVAGAYPVLDFDTQTLDELLKHGKALCPMPPFYASLAYVIT